MIGFNRLTILRRRRQAHQPGEPARWRGLQLAELAEVIGVAILALSAIAAVYQYWVARGDKHVEQTFAFVERFEDDRLVAAQRAVDDLAGRAGKTVEQQIAAYEQSGASPAELRTISDRLFVEAVLAQADARVVGDVPTPVLEITSFFNGLQICIEEELCDRSTAHAFLDTYAASFWLTFEPVILHMRGKDRPKLAEGLERFLDAAEEGRIG